MTHRCNHCQAENLVADNLAPGAPAPMCMRCGQAMQLAPASTSHAAPAGAAASQPPQVASGADAASGFEGSTVMVMRPNFQAAAAGSAPAAASVDEAWYALVNGAQEGPHTLLALRHAFREGRVQQDTLMWRAGMAAWTPLANLPDVHAALQAPPTLDELAQAQTAKALLNLVEEEVHGRAPAPAAAPVPAAAAPAAARPVVAATSVVARPKARRRLWGVAAAALVAAAVGVGVWTLRPRATSQVASAAPPSAPAVAPAPGGEAPAPAQATSAMTPPPEQAAPPAPAPAPGAHPAAAPGAAAEAPKPEAPAVGAPAAPPAGDEPALTPVKGKRHGGRKARHNRGHRGGHHD